MGPRPTRRQALRALGGSLPALLAGCLSRRGVDRGPTLAPPEGASADAFGWDVAHSERWTLVGAPRAGQRRRGAAYLYDADATTTRRLGPGTDTAGFGTAVALEDARAVVGAPATADPDTEGTVAVFSRDGGRWVRETRLRPPVPSPSDGEFGYDVALSGRRLLVGARATDSGDATDAGVAHVYERADGGWVHRARLAPRDASAYDYAGGSVALAGETALLGSFLADAPATDSGAGTVFERTDGWTQRATLTAPDAAAGDRFGNAVALSGDRALVGAVGRGGSPETAADTGGAYVFERADAGWRHATTLPGPAEDPDAAFGVAVALADGRALVGAFSSNGTGPGAAVRA